jgi:hypothetical protein
MVDGDIHELPIADCVGGGLGDWHMGPGPFWPPICDGVLIIPDELPDPSVGYATPTAAGAAVPLAPGIIDE